MFWGLINLFWGNLKYFFNDGQQDHSIHLLLTFWAEAAAALGEVGVWAALAAARGAAPGAGAGARGPVARRPQGGQRVLAGRHARAALDNVDIYNIF